MSVAEAPIPKATAGERLTHWVRSLTPFKIVSILVAIVFAFLALYPLSRVVLRLVVVDGQLDFSAFSDVFAQPDLGRVLLNTLIVVGGSASLALVIGSVIAWLNERTDARLGFATDLLPLVPFLLPPVAGAIGWVLLLSERSGLLNALIRQILTAVGLREATPVGTIAEGPFNIFSWWGMIFVFALYQIPYVFLMVSAGLRNMDPALEEQSRMSGAGLLRTLRKVTLPGLAPSIGAAVLLMVWFGCALFSVPAILGTGANIELLTPRIVRELTFTFPPNTGVAVGLSMFVVLSVGTAWFLQRRILRRGRHVTVSGKGHRISRIRLGAWRWPARVFVLGYVFVAAVMPAIALILVTLNGFWTPNINWGALDFDAFERALVQDVKTRESLINSVLLGVVGASIGLFAAAIVALYVQRASGRVAAILDGAIKLPAAISTIVVAVGVVLAFSGPPFNLGGTLAILLIAYVALYMPQGAVAADAAAGQVGKDLPEASYVSGAGSGRTFRKVYVPIMLPGLIAGWALLFVRMTGDLSASALLSGTSNPVVGARILQVYSAGSYPLLAALALCLTIVTATVLLVVMGYTRRRTRVGVGAGAERGF